jgi:dolichyl-phosphate-mannose--protein O-mannosyl transferase
VHFGKFIGGYISGHYFFDIHPPFGKLLIALVAYLGGYRTTQVGAERDPSSPNQVALGVRG